MFHTINPRDEQISWSDLQNVPDPELIRQLRSGNNDAFAVIVDRYQRLVLTVALRIVKEECEAEDVVQTVFLEVFKNVGKFDASRGTLKVWLLQYAYSRSINRRRYLEHRQHYSQLELNDAEAENYSADDVRFDRLSPGETSRFVRQALKALNPKQQSAIELVYFEGLTLEEAAQRTGETLSSMRHHYYRGLMKLREFITATSSTLAENISAVPIELEVPDPTPRPI